MTYAPLGKGPELAWLPIDRLDVDPAYQRSVESTRSKHLIAKVAQEFRWARFGVVLAAKNGDRWTVIDGQHRVMACKLRGDITHVPSVVFPQTTVAEAAADFVAVNRDRVAVNPLSIHKAMLAAGDPRAKEVETLCTVNGVKICRYPVPANKLKPGETLALSTILSMVRNFGPTVAGRVLRLLARVYDGQSGRINADYIKAVLKVVTSGVADDNVEVVLRTYPQASINEAARRIQSVDGGPLATHIADAIQRRQVTAQRVA